MSVTNVCGADVVIHPRECSLAIVRGAMLAIRSDRTADTKTEHEALKAACHGYAAAKFGRGMVIQSLKSRRQGIECCLVKRGENANDYIQTFTAKCIEGTIVTTGADSGELQRLFDQQMATVPVGGVRGLVEEILVDDLDAVKLVPSLYWIPDESIAHWKTISMVCQPFLKSYCMPKALSGDSIDIVVNKITEFIERERDRMIEAAANGCMSDRAMERRNQEALRLMQRIESVEQSLGVTLDVAREALESARNEVCLTADI